MTPRDLRVGEVYFAIDYRDPSRLFPLIITYEYLGMNIGGEGHTPDGDVYYFSYLPSFVPEEEIEGYSFSTQATFEGVAHTFAAGRLAVLCDLNGLIAELSGLRRRVDEIAGAGGNPEGI